MAGKEVKFSQTPKSPQKLAPLSGSWGLDRLVCNQSHHVSHEHLTQQNDATKLHGGTWTLHFSWFIIHLFPHRYSSRVCRVSCSFGKSLHVNMIQCNETVLPIREREQGQFSGYHPMTEGAGSFEETLERPIVVLSMWGQIDFVTQWYKIYWEKHLLNSAQHGTLLWLGPSHLWWWHCWHSHMDGCTVLFSSP